MTDEAYYRATIDELEAAYLAGDNPRAQSGFSGDEAYWERSRRVCIEPVDRDGTYLDVGCANGYLMECVERWAVDDGYRIEAHGLELSARLAGLAHSRLPEMADRIHTGNVMTWAPPRRYTYVRTLLDCVPPWRGADQVERLLADYVEPDGVAIICSYGSSRNPANRTEPVAEMLTEWGFDVRGTAQATAANGVVVTEVAWVTAARAALLS